MSAGIHVGETVIIKTTDLPPRIQALLQLSLQLQALAVQTFNSGRLAPEEDLFKPLQEKYTELVATAIKEGAIGNLSEDPSDLRDGANFLWSFALGELQMAVIRGEWAPPELDLGMKIDKDPILNFRPPMPVADSLEAMRKATSMLGSLTR